MNRGFSTGLSFALLGLLFCDPGESANVKFFWTQENEIYGASPRAFVELRNHDPSGNSPNIVEEFSSELSGGVDVNGSKIYFGVSKDLSGPSGVREAKIMVRDSGGGGVTSLMTLADSRVNALTTSSSSIFYSTTEMGFGNLGGVFTMGLTGGSPTKILNQTAGSLSLTADALFYTDGGIWTSGLDGSNPMLLVDQYAGYLSVYEGKIYWADDSNSGEIFRSNLDGSGVESIADLSSGAVSGLPYDIEVVAGRVYFTLEGAGNSSGVNIASMALNGADRRLEHQLTPGDAGVDFGFAYDLAVVQVPEPSVSFMLCGGLIGLGFSLRSRKLS